MRSHATAAFSAIALTLLLASTALAGGWANAIMDAPPDDPGGPNQPITIGFTLLQHGVTPVEWGPTQVVLTNEASGETVTFDAQPQGAAGHWVAEVSVPANGTWTYLVRHDLEIGMTGFNPITVGGTAAAAGAASSLALQPALLMVGGFLALLAMVAATAGFLAYRHTRLYRASA
jgi:hypothetical protein